MRIHKGGYLQALTVLLLAVYLASCGGSVRIPEDHFYRLEIASSPIRTQSHLAEVLMVQVSSAAPIYRDRSLLYSEAGFPNRLQRHHYHHWIDSPPRMLERSLSHYLQTAQVAKTVVMSADRIASPNRLMIEIERFEHQRGDALVVIQVRVLGDVLTGNESCALILHAHEPVTGADMPAVVAAYARGVERIFRELVVRLDR